MTTDDTAGGAARVSGMSDERRELSDGEIRKDTAQSIVEATATTVASVAGIVAGAVRDVTREIGNLGTEVFAMRDAARRARDDRPADGAADRAADRTDD